MDSLPPTVHLELCKYLEENLFSYASINRAWYQAVHTYSRRVYEKESGKLGIKAALCFGDMQRMRQILQKDLPPSKMTKIARMAVFCGRKDLISYLRKRDFTLDYHVIMEALALDKTLIRNADKHEEWIIQMLQSGFADPTYILVYAIQHGYCRVFTFVHNWFVKFEKPLPGGGWVMRQSAGGIPMLETMQKAGFPLHAAHFRDVIFTRGHIATIHYLVQHVKPNWKNVAQIAAHCTVQEFLSFPELEKAVGRRNDNIKYRSLLIKALCAALNGNNAPMITYLIPKVFELIGVLPDKYIIRIMDAAVKCEDKQHFFNILPLCDSRYKHVEFPWQQMFITALFAGKIEVAEACRLRGAEVEKIMEKLENEPSVEVEKHGAIFEYLRPYFLKEIHAHAHFFAFYAIYKNDATALEDILNLRGWKMTTDSDEKTQVEIIDEKRNLPANQPRKYILSLYSDEDMLKTLRGNGVTVIHVPYLIGFIQKYFDKRVELLKVFHKLYPEYLEDIGVFDTRYLALYALQKLKMTPSLQTAAQLLYLTTDVKEWASYGVKITPEHVLQMSLRSRNRDDIMYSALQNRPRKIEKTLRTLARYDPTRYIVPLLQRLAHYRNLLPVFVNRKRNYYIYTMMRTNEAKYCEARVALEKKDLELFYKLACIEKEIFYFDSRLESCLHRDIKVVE